VRASPVTTTASCHLPKSITFIELVVYRPSADGVTVDLVPTLVIGRAGPPLDRAADTTTSPRGIGATGNGTNRAGGVTTGPRRALLGPSPNPGVWPQVPDRARRQAETRSPLGHHGTWPPLMVGPPPGERSVVPDRAAPWDPRPHGLNSGRPASQLTSWWLSRRTESWAPSRTIGMSSFPNSTASGTGSNPLSNKVVIPRS
jgi:hypothetical protein